MHLELAIASGCTVITWIGQDSKPDTQESGKAQQLGKREGSMGALIGGS
jgi:hypothetical protein